MWVPISTTIGSEDGMRPGLRLKIVSSPRKNALCVGQNSCRGLGRSDPSMIREHADAAKMFVWQDFCHVFVQTKPSWARKGLYNTVVSLRFQLSPDSHHHQTSRPQHNSFNLLFFPIFNSFGRSVRSGIAFVFILPISKFKTKLFNLFFCKKTKQNHQNEVHLRFRSRPRWPGRCQGPPEQRQLHWNLHQVSVQAGRQAHRHH